MRHLAGDSKANVVIMGDFNEGHPVGSAGQALDARGHYGQQHGGGLLKSASQGMLTLPL